MKKSLYPKRVKSKDPVVILRHVAKAILEEPKRYNQDVFLVRRGEFPAEEFPTCGTIACVAGWVCQIADGKISDNGLIAQRAAKILGISECDPLFSSDDGTCEPTGTKKYAIWGVRRIQKFVKDEYGRKLGLSKLR